MIVLDNFTFLVDRHFSEDPAIFKGVRAIDGMQNTFFVSVVISIILVVFVSWFRVNSSFTVALRSRDRVAFTFLVG